ncbi:MAG: TonB-dependent receptor [Nitrospirae bacterium]|nr:TonB-dependent receptor [Nitrospirota bacterium]MBF0591161.1 TonB-dependent receptor [Nitrospirota bacterium]
MKIIKQFINTLIIVIFLMGVSSAESPGEPDKDDANRYEAELKWLQAEAVVIYTDIATKTLIDVDLAPGVVTVLLADDLKRRGIRNVIEALNLVPGVMANDRAITKDAVSRGISGGGTYLGSNFMYMVDSIPLNMNLGNLFEFLFPIEMVERIEVIQGSGSVVYGRWAFAGVVNIVTRKDEVSAYGGYGSFSSYDGGGNFFYEDKANALKISLNAAGMGNNRSGVRSGTDMLSATPYSHAPGPINDRSQLLSSVLNVNYNDLYLKGIGYYDSSGAGYGTSGILPPLDNRLVNRYTSYTAETGWQKEVADNIKPRVYIGVKKIMNIIDNEWLLPPIPGYDPNGMQMTSHYAEQAIYSGIEVNAGELWRGNTLLAGLEGENIRTMDTWLESNFDPETFAALDGFQPFSGDKNFLRDHIIRNRYSAFIHDQYDITDMLTLTSGVRLDSYSDVGKGVSPMVSLLYKPHKQHILELQLTKGFRPPTFIEMYSNSPLLQGNRNLHSETVKTLEFQYIYKIESFRAGATAFYSLIDNLIFIDSDSTPRPSLSYLDYNFFANKKKEASSKGVELELKFSPITRLILDGNISYAYTHDNDTGGELAESTRWLANVGVTYQFIHDMYLNLQNRYVGSTIKDSTSTTAIDYLSAYDTTNITFSAENLIGKGFTVRAGVKNIFDADVKTASNLFNDGYQQPGRQVWISLYKRFK